MADQHQGAAAGLDLAFQPFDGIDVQVVGRLVQQQDVGTRRQGTRQRGAASFAARQGGGIFIAAQAQIAQQVKSAVGIFVWVQPRFDIIAGGGIAAHIRLLRQVAHRGAGLDKHSAAISFHQPGRDLEQGGLARAVAPHQAQPVARPDAEFGAIQQALAAEFNGDVFQVQKRRHAPLCAVRRPAYQGKSSGCGS